ncbi:MAG: putative response regulatory protein [Spirochaetes bacterium ADurb.Bin315]|jgi:AraC-like DNA-binding protein|nr:MAG: putative response regulatory protein [Spirochaetes bacterium ADurb.Bin315]
MYDVQLQKRQIGIRVERELINKFCAIFLHDGEYELSVNEKHYSIKQPSIVLLGPGDFFSLEASRQKATLSKTYDEIDFDDQWMERVSDSGTILMECFTHKQISGLHCILLEEDQAEVVKEAIEEIRKLDERKKDEYGNALTYKLKTAELLILINRLYRINNSFILTNKALVVSDAVQRVSDYIRVNYWDEISIEMLSVMFRINRNLLCKQFKELMGVSPIQYLINYRLSSACSFLEQGFSVEETCSKVGFSNLPHFSKSFKKRYGVSPSQYQGRRISKD